MRPDYLADARTGRLPLDRLRGFLESSGKVTREELAAAETKFALISLAEDKHIDLEPLLAGLGPTPDGPIKIEHFFCCNSFNKFSK